MDRTIFVCLKANIIFYHTVTSDIINIYLYPLGLKMKKNEKEHVLEPVVWIHLVNCFGAKHLDHIRITIIENVEEYFQIFYYTKYYNRTVGRTTSFNPTV